MCSSDLRLCSTLCYDQTTFLSLNDGAKLKHEVDKHRDPRFISQVSIDRNEVICNDFSVIFAKLALSMFPDISLSIRETHTGMSNGVMHTSSIRLLSVFIKMPGDFQSDYFQIFNPFKPDRFSLASPKINAPNTFRRAIPFTVATSRGAVARVRSCACDLFATRNRHAPTFFTITRSHP